MGKKKAMKSVERGIEFLDSRIPGWFNRIDLERLDLESCGACVLGQIGAPDGHDYVAMRRELLGLGRFDEDAEDVTGKYGFDTVGCLDDVTYENLTEIWRDRLRVYRDALVHS